MEILGPGVPPVVNVRWPARIPAVAARTRRYNESLLYRAEYACVCSWLLEILPDGTFGTIYFEK